MKGLIIKSTGSWYMVANHETQEIIPCRIRGKFRLQNLTTTNPLAVGDIVNYEIEKNEHPIIGTITELENRKNYIVRKSKKLSSKSQIIASNIDLVLPVFTLAYPKTSSGFLDRILLTAEAYNIPVLIVFNKIDLYDDELLKEVNYLMKKYQSIGYDTISVSAINKDSLLNLGKKIKHKSSLICGHSGVGKSTLINALCPGLELKTSNISLQHLKGKHTTTFVEMHFVNKNTALIDTPGIRDFGIIDINQTEVGHYFPEIRNLMNRCKYNNCIHVNEPECAVMQAVEDNTIYPERYYNYLSIINNEDSFL
jgi:ribosome biogenesis GTPase